MLVARTSEVRAERLRRLGLIENSFDALTVDAELRTRKRR
jgi:hypothetical protein